MAYTTNTLTCLAYAAGLLAWAWLRAPGLEGDPLAAEWTWGLAVVAALTLVKRYESFLIAILRAHRAFVLNEWFPNFIPPLRPIQRWRFVGCFRAGAVRVSLRTTIRD